MNEPKLTNMTDAKWTRLFFEAGRDEMIKPENERDPNRLRDLLKQCGEWERQQQH